MLRKIGIVKHYLESLRFAVEKKYSEFTSENEKELMSYISTAKYY